jgi:hypothetical protein
MKAWFLAASVCVFGLYAATPAAAETLGYPNMEKASFIVDYPDDWTMEPGENLGDYVTLTSPSGVSLQLRTIPATDTAIDDAVNESEAFLNETFSNVQLGDAKDIEAGGLSGSLLLGSGTDKEKQDILFAIYLIALPDGTMADIWYAAFKGDKEGSNAAAEILNSFRTK